MRSSSMSLGTLIRIARRISVNWGVRSMRSSVPVASQSMACQMTREGAAIARKVKTKQSATAAINSASGDHWSPGPPNSLGASVARVTSPSLAT